MVYILRVGSWKAVLSMGRACSVAGDQVSDGAAKWTVDGCFDLGQFRPHVELYQLDSDPQEKQDLWHQTTTTNTTTAGGQQSEDDTLGHYRQRGDYVPQQPRGMRGDLRALVRGFLTLTLTLTLTITPTLTFHPHPQPHPPPHPHPYP